MINNTFAANIDSKAKEFTEILKEQYYPWFAQYMVMKRLDWFKSYVSCNCLKNLHPCRYEQGYVYWSVATAGKFKWTVGVNGEIKSIGHLKQILETLKFGFGSVLSPTLLC